jgi:hypothetical protein
VSDDFWTLNREEVELLLAATGASASWYLRKTPETTSAGSPIAGAKGLLSLNVLTPTVTMAISRRDRLLTGKNPLRLE